MEKNCRNAFCAMSDLIFDTDKLSAGLRSSGLP